MFYFMIGNDFLVHSSGHLMSTDAEVYAEEIQAHVEHAFGIYCGIPTTVTIHFAAQPPQGRTLVLPSAVDADFAHVD